VKIKPDHFNHSRRKTALVTKAAPRVQLSDGDLFPFKNLEIFLLRLLKKNPPV